MRYGAAIGVALAAVSACLASTPGTETRLPIDADVTGAWWRARAPGLPAEAVHYAPTGRYLRIAEGGLVEQGIWVALVRGDLRWLRRCPARGAQVGPADCTYFGRYRMGEKLMLEEAACPDSWEGSLTGGLAFDKAEARCASPAHRFADTASEFALRARLEEVEAAEPVAASAEADDGGFVVKGGGDVAGVWVGTVGSGPEQVRLVFTAMAEGAFYYSLQAAGQEETSSGEWSADGGTLVLNHPDGEVEMIPFVVKGDTLEWSDEDLGTLRLRRQG